MSELQNEWLKKPVLERSNWYKEHIGKIINRVYPSCKQKHRTVALIT